MVNTERLWSSIASDRFHDVHHVSVNKLVNIFLDAIQGQKVLWFKLLRHFEDELWKLRKLFEEAEWFFDAATNRGVVVMRLLAWSIEIGELRTGEVWITFAQLTLAVDANHFFDACIADEGEWVQRRLLIFFGLRLLDCLIQLL